MQMDKAHALELLVAVMTHHGAEETTLERVIPRAEARAGIAHLKQINEEQMNKLLVELASEGGRVQQAAEMIASWRIGLTDMHAA